MNVDGAPKDFSTDIEFIKENFMSALRYFGVCFEQKSRRRHYLE